MKRKLFLAVIAVLVLCLTCSMLLVACNDDKPNPDDDPNTPVVPGGDDEEEESAVVDAVKDLVDDLDVVAKDETKEFTFGLEITDKTKTEDASIFALATETVGGENYLYGAIGSEMRKFVGFDLGAVVDKIIGWFGEGISIGGVSIKFTPEWWKTLGAGIIADAALTDDFTVTEHAYRFEINLTGLANLIGPMADNAITENGLTDTISTVLTTVGGLIGLDVDSPATVSSFLGQLAAKYKLDVYFGFDGATADVENTNPFDTFALGERVAEARNANDGEAKNLLNFTLDGTAEFKDEAGVVTNRYDIDVDIDIDIFPLLGLLDFVKVDNMKFSFNVDDPSKIVEMVKQMGYINLTVDEISLDDGSFVKNVLTIHSNFAEGNAIVQLNGASVIIVDVGLGGVYDFDALASFIADMITGAVSQAEGEGGEGDNTPAEPSLIDTVLGVVQKLIVMPEGAVGEDGSINFGAVLSDITANGLNVKMSNIPSVLTDDFGIDLGSVGSLISLVWESADVMNITIENAGFGTAVRKATPDITAMESSSSTALVSKVTSIEGLPEVVLDASGFTTGLDHAYNMKGTSIATGEEVEFQGYIIGVSGLDESKSGKQTVTYYVAAANSGAGLVGMLAGTLDLSAYPVFGIYAYDAEVEIIIPDQDSAITAEGIVGGTYIPVALNTTVWSNIAITDPAYLVVDGVAKTAITSSNMQLYTEDGVLIPATDTTVFDANGNIIKAGRYEVRLTKGDIVYSFDIQAIEITSSTKAEIIPNEGTKEDILDKGVILGETFTFTGFSIKIGDYTFDMAPNDSTFDFATISSAVDGDTYTLAKNLNNITSKYFRWKLKRSDSTSTKSFSDSVSIKAPDGIKISKTSSLYFGQSIAKAITFTYNNVVYTLAYENGAWVAQDEDGNNLQGFTATVEWGNSAGSGKAVTVNANGLITNNLNEYRSGTRNQYFYVSFSVDGWTYGAGISAYELYGKTYGAEITAGDYLDGMIEKISSIASGYAFKYGAEGYGIYNGDELICAVTVKVFDAKDADITATVVKDGKVTTSGVYKVEYTLTYDGIAQKFFHEVTVLPDIKSVTPESPKVGMSLSGLVDLSALGSGYTFSFDLETNSYSVCDAEGKVAYTATVEVKQKDPTSAYKYNDYALVDGTIAEAGTYRIDITIDYNGIDVDLDRVEFTIL